MRASLTDFDTGAGPKQASKLSGRHGINLRLSERSVNGY
jgi:hypothetical protein